MCWIIFIGLAILAVILVPIIVKLTKKSWLIYLLSDFCVGKFWFHFYKLKYKFISGYLFAKSREISFLCSFIIFWLLRKLRWLVVSILKLGWDVRFLFVWFLILRLFFNTLYLLFWRNRFHQVVLMNFLVSRLMFEILFNTSLAFKLLFFMTLLIINLCLLL